MSFESDSDSTDEREEDKKLDFIDCANRMGLLAAPADANTNIMESEAGDLKQLLIALTNIDMGHKLVSSGTEKIRDIIACSPSLEKLSLLLGCVQQTDPNLLALVKKESEIPLTGGASVPDYLKPKKVDGKYLCKVCNITVRSWAGCDSHIRRAHTNIKYGPCRKCRTFFSTNYDSFRNHEKKCNISSDA